MLMSEEQHQRILEQNQEYERNMAEWAAKLDESVTEEHDQVEQKKDNSSSKNRKGSVTFEVNKTIHLRLNALLPTIKI